MKEASDGVRTLRTLTLLLDDGAPLEERLSAAARAIIGELADGVVLQVGDAGSHLWGSGFDGLARGLTLPLAAHGRSLGELTLVRGRARHDFDERERMLAAEIAARLASAIAADQLTREAATVGDYDRFLATLSHELRTPLAVVSGWIELLGDERLDDERRGRAIEIVARNARIQARLVEDLVEMSRIAVGGTRLELGTVSACELVLNAVEAVRPQAETSGLTLTASPGPAIELRGDGVRLAQVIANLVGNALRYTPAGGTIDVSMTSDGETATLTVSDTGAGIDPALLPHVFARFRQGERVRRNGSRGLGLGLYIVEHLVRLHGGTVTAASEGRGRGACFVVTLPIAGPAAS